MNNDQNYSESASSFSKSSNSDKSRTETLSSSKSGGSRRHQQQTGRNKHKRKLARQIIYEKTLKDPGEENSVINQEDLKNSLEESIKTLGTQMRIQNTINSFPYFPLYPVHVKSILSNQIMSPGINILNALPLLDFSTPMVKNYAEKTRDFQRACYLRESQQYSINLILENKEQMRSEFRLKLRPDPRLHPPINPRPLLLSQGLPSGVQTQWDASIREFFLKNISESEPAPIGGISRPKEERSCTIENKIDSTNVMKFHSEDNSDYLFGKDLNESQIDKYFD